MFKKAQLRLFAIITAILLAIFVGVLASVNLITEAVMEKQSKDIIRQIAADVEYDDKTGTFMYYGKIDNRDPRRDDPVDNDRPSSKPDTKPDMTEPSAVEDTTVDTTESTSEPPSEQPTQSNADPTPVQPQTTAPEKPTDAQTQPETTTEPPAVPTDSDFPFDPDERPSDPWGGDRPDPWGGGGGGQWGPGNGGGNRWSTEETAAQTAYFTSAREDIILLAGTDSTEPKNGSVQAPTGDVQRNEPPQNNVDPAQNSENSVPKSLGSIDFFVIMADPDGGYLATLNNDDITADTAQSYITEILRSDDEIGRLGNYQYCQTEKSNGTLIVFTDKSAEIDMLDQLNRTTIIIGAISVIVLSAAAFFLSRQIIKPLKIAFERQNQFVSDASHELKTPLTVISANADVLSDEIGENKWLAYIKSQADRMNVLVNDLLNLTRLENNTSSFIRTDFNLSQAITNTALPFECQAFETNKKFIVDVEDGITINGSEHHIKQMAAIFIDNALKYSNDGGMVRVTLKRQGDKKVFTVYNTGQGIKEDEKDKIFERFYRSDESRNRATGGYGLGLAIAKSVIDKHKFKVNVESVEGKNISFIVSM